MMKQILTKNERPLVLALLALVALSYLLVFPDLKNGWQLTYEDGPVENLGALAFLLTAVLFGLFFYRSKKSGAHSLPFYRRRNYLYLLLGLLFFVACGEEISWGQRIFGWETPEQLRVHNVQEETNLHNLDIFLHRSEDLEEQYGFLANFMVINPGRLFFLFWFSFLVLVPLAASLSPKAKRWLQAWRVPVGPLWVGGLMVLNMLVAKLLEPAVAEYAQGSYSNLDEFMETNYAIIIAGLAVLWWREKIYRQV